MRLFKDKQPYLSGDRSDSNRGMTLPLRLQEAKADEEMVHFLDAILIVLLSVRVGSAGIEEAVGSVFINMEVTASPGIFDRLLEGDSSAHGDEIVVVTQQKKGWGWRGDVVEGREPFPKFPDAIMPVAVDAIVDYGIKKQECVGLGGNFLIVTGVVEPFAKGRGRGQVTSCRTATDGEAVRIDSKGLCICFHIANGALGVDEADVGRH